jgi:formiminotetrahydrofolate cyclodeaminase
VQRESDLLDLPVRELLDELASAEDPLPGGGSAAAVVTATAAALVAMVARSSTDDWAEARAAAAQAQALRHRVGPLAQADADAFGRVMELLRADDPSSVRRDAELGRALSHAADLPLAIAEAAADVAELAALAAEKGRPAMRADAAAGAVLADAAARVGARLVAINLATAADDERIVRANEAATAAHEAARRAEALLEES